MANDHMRVGPRGSSDQAAFVAPTAFALCQGPAGAKDGTLYFTKADNALLGFPAVSSMGTTWEIVEIRINIVHPFDTNDCVIDIGFTGPSTDADAFVDGYVTGAADSAVGEYVVPLNGTDATMQFGGATNRILQLTNDPASGVAGGGRYTCTVFAKPVAGPRFTNA